MHDTPAQRVYTYGYIGSVEGGGKRVWHTLDILHGLCLDAIENYACNVGAAYRSRDSWDAFDDSMVVDLMPCDSFGIYAADGTGRRIGSTNTD
jgi:hypothetical protein